MRAPPISSSDTCSPTTTSAIRGDLLASSDAEAIDMARHYFTYAAGERFEPAPPAKVLTADLVPESPQAGYDIRRNVIEALVDEHSFFEVKPLWAPELVVGFGRLDGRPIGIVANNPAVKGGVLFVDSADKAARFIWACDSYGLPLLFLADVPGFMIGSQVERQGIIRHGAKMILSLIHI